MVSGHRPMGSPPFLLLLISISAASSDLNSDRVALLAFHAAVGDSRLNWTAATPCSWTGILCAYDRVTALRLPGSGLSGEIPAGTIGNLTALRTLSLRFNRLSGSLPDLSAAQSLRNLYLHGNRLSGEVPSTLFSLRGLVRLNLASNNLTGKISESFSNLSRLETLYLESNRLSGSIPDLNLPRLAQFNVSFNDLNGSIPDSLRRMPITAFLGMPLCGLPLSACDNGDKRNESSNLSGGAIAGIVIGCLFGFLIVCVILILICRRKRKTPDNGVVEAENRPLPPPPPVEAAAVKGGRAKMLVYFGGGERLFDLEDLLRASAEVLGKGAFGTTYRAVLETGTVVAVKRLKDASLSEREFRERIEELGAMEHRNLVPLHAFYFSKDEKLLVYDFMPVGSLSAFLHGNRGSGRAPLDWETRASVALAAARGIEYIHSTSPSASHGNIKSSNVLLAESAGARVSDYGLANLVGSAAAVPARVAGYRAPEVTDVRRDSQKADVYSFGVLLLELLTGKSPQQSLINDEGPDLPRWVQLVVGEEWTSDVLDPELLRCRDAEEDQMVRLLQLAVDCVAQYPERRPSMPEVVARIEDICRSSMRVVDPDHHQQQDSGIEEAGNQSSSLVTDTADESRPAADESVS